LQVATQLAEDMVMRLLGMRVFKRSEGAEAFAAPHSGQKTFEASDKAIHQILDECYAEAKRIVNDKLDSIERSRRACFNRKTSLVKNFSH
jgi:ATP-dependent Zn protease